MDRGPSAPKVAGFPHRPAVEVPAGYPWQVASPQSLLPFHWLTELSSWHPSLSIFLLGLSGRVLLPLVLPFGLAGLSGGGQLGVPGGQDGCRLASKRVGRG